VRAYLFDADGRDRVVELTAEVVRGLGERQLLWVDVAGRDAAALTAVGERLHLHRASLRTLLDPIGRPRLDNYGDYFQVNVAAARPAGARFAALELDLFSGPNYVVTVHPEPVPFLERFAAQLRGDTDLGQLDSPAFLAALLDWHVSSYFTALDGLEEEVERLDEAALRQRADPRFLEELAALRRRVGDLRRLLAPHREVFAALARPDFRVVAASESAAHFRALNDRLERALDAADAAREMVLGSFELFMTGTAQSTNDTVRVLTVVTVLIGLTGVIAGVMGMNFPLALFDSGAVGFAAVLAGMAATVAAVLLLARARGWL
jgi:Mg2+ and Co2+ transporter CorA